MAYQLRVQEKDPNEQQIVTPSGPSAMTGPASPSANFQASPTGSTAGPSGSFTNLQQYLQTNNPQATQYAGKVAERIGQEGTEAQQAIDTARTQFGEHVQSATPQYQQQLVSEAVANPQTFLQDQAKLAALTSMQAGYGGPTTLQQAGLNAPVDKEVGEAQTFANLGQTAGGRTEVLKQVEGARPYARGGLSLDQYLLQNVEPARQKVSSAFEALAPVQQQYEQLQTDIGERVGQARTQAQQVGEQTKQALTGAVTGFEDQLQQRTQQQRDQATALQDQVRQALSGIDQSQYQQRQIDPVTRQVLSGYETIQSTGDHDAFVDYSKPIYREEVVTPGTTEMVTPESAGQITDQQLASLGIDRNQWNRIAELQRQALGYDLGATPTNYLTFTDPNALYTPQSVATADDYARYQALSQLAGRQPQLLTGYQPTQTYGIQPVQFNAAGLEQTLQGQVSGAKAQQEAMRAQQEMIAAQKKAASKACFIGGTPVVMADGSTKPVEQIVVGDQVLLGGMVVGHGVNLEEELFEYRGAIVAGSHAVYEDNTWVRVRDAKYRNDVKLEDGEYGSFHKVYPIVTENHLMVVGDFISADFAELDAKHDFNDNDRLAALNMLEDRNKQLTNVLTTVFPDRYAHLKEAA